MTALGIICVAGCMLMMVAMMGGAGWLMSKLRPDGQDGSAGRTEAGAETPSQQQVQPLA
jgi:hypothetical protein